MKKRIRPGIMALISVKIKGKKKYLLMKRKMYWTGWELVKGGKKKGETEIQAMKREVREEIGKKPDEYSFKKTKLVFKFLYDRPFVHDFQLWDGMNARVYLIKLHDSRIKPDTDEHSGYKWFSKKDALKTITHEDQKRIFKKLA